jgi:hypothetical protein
MRTNPILPRNYHELTDSLATGWLQDLQHPWMIELSDLLEELWYFELQMHGNTIIWTPASEAIYTRIQQVFNLIRRRQRYTSSR